MNKTIEVKFDKPIIFECMKDDFPAVGSIEFEEPKRPVAKYIGTLKALISKSRRVAMQEMKDLIAEHVEEETKETEEYENIEIGDDEAKAAIEQLFFGLDDKDTECVYNSFDKILANTSVKFNGETKMKFRSGMLDEMTCSQINKMLGYYIANFITGSDF